MTEQPLCAWPGCRTRLSTLNPGPLCWNCEDAGRTVPEPEDLDAPFCRCGCGERTQRRIQSHNGHPQRTGPYQLYQSAGCRARTQGKVVTHEETESRTAPEEAAQTAQTS